MRIFGLRSTMWAGLALTCLLGMSASVRGQGKVGTIDLKKVFDGYYRTKQADSQLRGRAADVQKVLDGMMQDLQKANEEYRRLVETANDQALSQEERARRKKNAEAKLSEIQDIEASVKQYNQTSRTALAEQEQRMRENILRGIQEVITKRARAGNYSLVIDTAAETRNLTPVILYTNGENDLTDEILREINAQAPAGLLTPAEK